MAFPKGPIGARLYDATVYALLNTESPNHGPIMGDIRNQYTVRSVEYVGNVSHLNKAYNLRIEMSGSILDIRRIRTSIGNIVGIRGVSEPVLRNERTFNTAIENL